MGSPVADWCPILEEVDAVAVCAPIFGLNAMIAAHLGRWGPSVRDIIELLRSEVVAQDVGRRLPDPSNLRPRRSSAHRRCVA